MSPVQIGMAIRYTQDMTTTVKTHRGSCGCGAIKFSFTGSLDDVWFCHCSQCRKNYGMYGAFVGALRDSFKINRTKKLLSYKSSSNTTRTFCGNCGASITWDRKGYARVYVLLGLLDEKARIKSAQHIFTKDKGAYYDICDHWPQFKTAPK